MKKKQEFNYNPNSKEDLHRYFFNMPQWYNSENLAITSRDFAPVCTELIEKFTGISEEYICNLVKKYRSRLITGIYTPDGDDDLS